MLEDKNLTNNTETLFTFMISFETFEKCIKAIQYQDKLDDKLTDLLVDKDCTGWVKTGGVLIDAMISLLQELLKDKYEYVSWWLYDISNNNKFVYEDIDDTREVKYDLNDLRDLYYYIIKDFENVKQSVVYKNNKSHKNVKQDIISLKEFFDKAFEGDNE